MEFTTVLLAKIGLIVFGFSLAYVWRICVLNELLEN